MEEVLTEIRGIRADVTELKIADAKKGVVLDEVKVDLAEHMHRTKLLEKFTSRWAMAWTILGGVAVFLVGLLGALANAAKIADFFLR